MAVRFRDGPGRSTAAAFALIGTTGALWSRGRHQIDTNARRWAYDAATCAAPPLLVLLWVLRGSLDLNVLLPGLAWRSFVVLHGLPAAVAVAVWRAATSSAVLHRRRFDM